jgi:hypothetical protein
VSSLMEKQFDFEKCRISHGCGQALRLLKAYQIILLHKKKATIFLEINIYHNKETSIR